MDDVEVTYDSLEIDGVKHYTAHYIFEIFRDDEEIKEMERKRDSIGGQYFPVEMLPKTKTPKYIKDSTTFYFNAKTLILIKKESESENDLGERDKEVWNYTYHAVIE
jgi:hypothetical protein